MREGVVFYVVVVVFVIALGDLQLIDAVAAAGGHLLHLVGIDIYVGVGGYLHLVALDVVVAERDGHPAPVERGVFAQVRIHHQRVVGAVLIRDEQHLRTCVEWVFSEGLRNIGQNLTLHREGVPGCCIGAGCVCLEVEFCVAFVAVCCIACPRIDGYHEALVRVVGEGGVELYGPPSVAFRGEVGVCPYLVRGEGIRCSVVNRVRAAVVGDVYCREVNILDVDFHVLESIG